MALPNAKKVSLSEVPIIDVAALRSQDAEARRALAQAIADACGDLGFFYIVNHGIPPESLRSMYDAGKKYFSLAPSQQVDVRMSKATNFNGHLPLQSMNKKPKFNASPEELKGNLYEAFQIHAELPADDPDVIAKKQLRSRNPFPAAVPELRATMLVYFDQLKALSMEMLKLFALGLDLPEAIFLPYFEKPLAQLRIIHYPPQPPDDPGQNIGIRPHTDVNAFTILAQDDVGGLEVMTRRGEWIQVPPLADSYVVNIGEILKVWTDGTFQATPHRVINTYGAERFSIPFFMSPDYDVEITPLMTNADQKSAPTFATSLSKGRTCGNILWSHYERIWPVPAA